MAMLVNAASTQPLALSAGWWLVPRGLTPPVEKFCIVAASQTRSDSGVSLSLVHLADLPTTTVASRRDVGTSGRHHPTTGRGNSSYGWQQGRGVRGRL